MTFNIRQPFYDDDGYFLEKEVEHYRETLLKQFEESPEGQTYLQGKSVDWADLLLDLLIQRMQLPLHYLDATALRDIFYTIIPAHVVINVKDAPTVIAELTAFFQFLERVYSLPHTQSCLKVLQQKTLLNRFKRELTNTDNYSPTKTILTEMLEAGVDLEDKSQIEQFITTYNAKIMETHKPPPVTDKAQAQHKAVKKLMRKVCSSHLDKEYFDLSVRLLDQFLFQYADRLERGQARSWAAAMVHTIGRVNFLSDPATTPYMLAEELAKAFGVSQSNMSKKSSELFDLFDLMQLDPEWTLPSRVPDNPFIWMTMVDGLLIDLRREPREVQVEAFKRGIIPYIPADRD